MNTNIYISIYKYIDIYVYIYIYIYLSVAILAQAVPVVLPAARGTHAMQNLFISW